MVAGSMAGMSEHVFMYPADTVKTRMQADASRMQPQYKGVFNALGLIVKSEGVRGLYRGVPAVMLGAIPGHALHFSAYEGTKQRLGGSHTMAGRDKSESATAIADMLAGAAATLVHDGISTPVDVVKQRMQLFGQEGYKGGIFSVAGKIFREEGANEGGWLTEPCRVCTGMVTKPRRICTRMVTKPDRFCTEMRTRPGRICTRTRTRPCKVCTRTRTRPCRICTGMVTKPGRFCTGMRTRPGLVSEHQLLYNIHWVLRISGCRVSRVQGGDILSGWEHLPGRRSFSPQS
ncbi:mitochondrial carrier domain-containing protein [Baffinella frigidus]|nr:mitochondrial carrier domain-containing protein [Cryptophyta sp. CCMP2293]